MEFVEFVSLLATATTMLLFLTPIPLCRKIIRKGTTADISFFPFVVMFCNATLWLKYGLLSDNGTLIFVNTVGAFIFLVYLGLFYSYTGSKGPVHRQLLFGAFLLFPILIYLKYYGTDRDVALNRMGIYTSSVGVLSYGAPLAAVSNVLRTRSTETMAFPLSVMNFFVALLWYLYGYLISDPYVQVPNFLGIILGMLQLGLFVKFPHHRAAATTTTTTQSL